MKKMILFGFLSLLALNSYATVDAHDKVYIVVRHIQGDGFFVERAPVIGCYGLAQGPQLLQFTAEYRVNSNMGCGSAGKETENINYLTCAKITKSVESPDYQGFSHITLDISKCDAKNDPQLITMIRTAAKYNFPQKKGEVNLTIVK